MNIIDPRYAKIVWGVDCDFTASNLEISNLPPDAIKVRIRMRKKREGHAFVKFHNRVEDWVLGLENGRLFLMIRQAVNA
jgi:hypothetical protein